MKYDLIFTKAWRTVWKHKVLWLFGLLSGCVRNAGGTSGSNSGHNSSVFPQGGMLASPALSVPKQINHWLLMLKQGWESEPWAVVLFILALLFFIILIVVASFFFGTLGRVGVARGAWIADEDEPLRFGRVFNESLPYFWRVFFLAFLIFLIVTVFISILIFPVVLLSMATFGGFLFMAFPFLLPISLILLLFAVVLFAITEQAVVAIVVEDLGTFDSLQRAWNLFRDYPVQHFVVGGVLFLGQSTVSIIIALPFLLVFIPLFISIFFETKVAIGIGAGLSGISFMLYLPLLLALTGLLHAYIGTAWVETFRQLKEKSAKQN